MAASTQSMVTKCANSSCEAVFRYFRGGRLFLVEGGRRGQATPSLHSQAEPLQVSASVQHFWLCERCAKHMTVISTTTDGQSICAVRPRPPVGNSELRGPSPASDRGHLGPSS